MYDDGEDFAIKEWSLAPGAVLKSLAVVEYPPAWDAFSILRPPGSGREGAVGWGVSGAVIALVGLSVMKAAEYAKGYLKQKCEGYTTATIMLNYLMHAQKDRERNIYILLDGKNSSGGPRRYTEVKRKSEWGSNPCEKH